MPLANSKQNLHALFLGQLFHEQGGEEFNIQRESRQSDKANKPRALRSLGFSEEVDQLKSTIRAHLEQLSFANCTLRTRPVNELSKLLLEGSVEGFRHAIKLGSIEELGGHEDLQDPSFRQFTKEKSLPIMK